MRVVIRMVGGPWDGFEAYNRSRVKFEALLAHAAWASTQYGQLGAEFVTPSLSALEALVQDGLEEAHRRGLYRPHTYRVIDRQVEDDLATLVLEYAPTAADEEADDADSWRWSDDEP